MILVEPEPVEANEPLERCVFCRQETNYWYQRQIACCPSCAAEANVEDLPTKAQWIRRERIATPPCTEHRGYLKSYVYVPVPKERKCQNCGKTFMEVSERMDEINFCPEHRVDFDAYHKAHPERRERDQSGAYWCTECKSFKYGDCEHWKSVPGTLRTVERVVQQNPVKP